MDIVQFLMDVIWFGDITFSLLFFSILIGFVLVVFIVVIPISSGVLEYKAKPINTTKPNHRAIVFGNISAEEPFLWEDISCAYFHNEKEGIRYPPNEKLRVTDDTGELEILLKDAEIVGKTRAIDGTLVQYIEQGDAYFIRGILNNERQFETTYVDINFISTDGEKKEPTVSRAVDIQQHSFLLNVYKDIRYFLVAILLVVLVFEAYPLYSYYSYWESEVIDVVESKREFRMEKSIRLRESDISFDVTSSQFEVCEPNIRVIKPAKSLAFGCGDTPETMYLRNRPLWEQMLTNWKLILFGIIMLFIVMSPEEQIKNG